MTQNTSYQPGRVFQDVKRRLCRRIVTDWPEDNRLPPIRRLAEEFGVGLGSANQAVRDLVEMGLLVSKPGMGTYVNGGQEEMADRLEEVVSGSARPVAGVVQLLYRQQESHRLPSFLQKILQAFEEVLSRSGLILRAPQPVPVKVHKYDDFIDPSADAVVFLNPDIRIPLKGVGQQVLSIISTNSRAAILATERYDLVSVDDYQGFCRIGQLLREWGHDDVCFLGVQRWRGEKQLDEPDASTAWRLGALETSLGREIPQEHQLLNYAYDAECGAELAGRWLNLTQRPAMIVAACDNTAMGFIHGLLSHGLRPGRDYQIIGFDGIQMEPSSLYGMLSSVAIDPAELGTTAARLLIERLARPDITPRRLQLGCRLIQGDTAGPRDCN